MSAVNAFKLCSGAIFLGAGLLCGAVVVYWVGWSALRAEISAGWILRAVFLVAVAGTGCGAMIGGGVALLREARRGLRADRVAGRDGDGWGERGP